MKNVLSRIAFVLGLTAVTGFIAGRHFRPPDMELPILQLPRSIEELIIDESLSAGIPPDFALELAWEESRLNPRAVRHEGNGTWSTGIFQVNRRQLVFELDVRQQIREGIAIAAHWWRKTHDRGLAKLAYRRGHL